MPEVDPDADESTEPGDDDGVIFIIEEFGYLIRGLLLAVSLKGFIRVVLRRDDRLTARKKSEMSCVTYTAKPMYVK